jgi:hypothetical protein
MDQVGESLGTPDLSLASGVRPKERTPLVLPGRAFYQDAVQ